MLNENEIVARLKKRHEELMEKVSANRIEFIDIDPYSLANEYLGYTGAMLSGSKQATPERNVVWNANVFANKMKIWYGDLSITEQEQNLQELANRLNVTIYVLSEFDGRFDNEGDPKLENARAKFEPQEV